MSAEATMSRTKGRTSEKPRQVISLHEPLPCPFCGGRPEVKYHADSHPAFDDPHWAIFCAGEVDCRVMPVAIAPTRLEAIAAWNQRA
jgi:hypothetical protein